MPRGHVRPARERLDVERLRVLPVDPVADPPQAREVCEVQCAVSGLLSRISRSPTSPPVVHLGALGGPNVTVGGAPVRE